MPLSVSTDVRRTRANQEGHHDIAGETLPSRRFKRGGVGAITVLLTLSFLAPGLAQPVDLVPTPLSPAATPGTAATPRSAATPVSRQANASGGISSRLLGQQSAAQATIAAYATRETLQATQIAVLEAALTEVQVTATALVVVAANTVLDPTRQSITLQTNLEGMLSGDTDTVAEARMDLTRLLERYPPGCRAGFMLISGTAPSVAEGIALAQRFETMLREERPTIFTEATGVELFALPDQTPFGRVSIDIFFYAGCQPTG